MAGGSKKPKRTIRVRLEKTSGEGYAEIVIRIVGVPSVDIRTVRIEVADVHEVAIRRTAFPLHISIRGRVSSGQWPDCCMNMWR